MVHAPDLRRSDALAGVVEADVAIRHSEGFRNTQVRTPSGRRPRRPPRSPGRNRVHSSKPVAWSSIRSSNSGGMFGGPLPRRVDADGETAQEAAGVPRVTLDFVGEPQAARLPAVVFHSFQAAEVDPGAPQRLPPGQPGSNPVLGVGIEMKSHLLVEGVLEALPSGPGRQERTQAREHVRTWWNSYRWRSAAIGLTRDARCAGTNPAPSATAASANTAAATTGGVRPSIS